MKLFEWKGQVTRICTFFRILIVLVTASSIADAAFSFLSPNRQCVLRCKSIFNPCHCHTSIQATTRQDSPSQSNTARSSTSTRDIQSLSDWASENGVRFHNNVGLVANDVSDDWGVSLLTSRSDDPPQTILEVGTIVLSVPTWLVLSSTRVAKELVDVYNLDLQETINILEDCGFGNQTPEFLLFVKISMESTEGRESLWHPWLDSLPQTFSTGVYMSSFEKSCLPPFAFALAEFETSKLQAFRQALSCLLEQPTAECSLTQLKTVASKQQQDGDTDDLIKWAYSVVFSRCWKYADQVEDNDSNGIGRSDIVPLGDMFNHADPANVVVNYVESGQDDIATGENSKDDETKDAVKFVLTEDISVDEERPQLSLSYGLTTNPYRFLILFGFVNDQMRELFCQVLFTNPSKEMVELGCADRAKMVYRTEDGAITDTVWDTVLYSLLEQQTGNADAEATRKMLYQAHLDGDTKTKAAIREKYLLETSLTLRNHVERTLKEFDELIAKVDSIIEASGDISLVEKEYPHLPMIHRHNRFIQGVFQKVKNRLDILVQTEMTQRRQAMAESQEQ